MFVVFLTGVQMSNVNLYSVLSSKPLGIILHFLSSDLNIYILHWSGGHLQLICPLMQVSVCWLWEPDCADNGGSCRERRTACTHQQAVGRYRCTDIMMLWLVTDYSLDCVGHSW